VSLLAQGLYLADGELLPSAMSKLLILQCSQGKQPTSI
jgi:hypothetical protein